MRQLSTVLISVVASILNSNRCILPDKGSLPNLYHPDSLPLRGATSKFAPTRKPPSEEGGVICSANDGGRDTENLPPPVTSIHPQPFTHDTFLSNKKVSKETLGAMSTPPDPSTTKSRLVAMSARDECQAADSGFPLERAPSSVAHMASAPWRRLRSRRHLSSAPPPGREEASAVEVDEVCTHPEASL